MKQLHLYLCVPDGESEDFEEEEDEDEEDVVAEDDDESGDDEASRAAVFITSSGGRRTPPRPRVASPVWRQATTASSLHSRLAPYFYTEGRFGAVADPGIDRGLPAPPR